MLTAQASAIATNTTIGRRTQTPVAEVVALYPMTSSACKVRVVPQIWGDPYCAVPLRGFKEVTLDVAATGSPSIFSRIQGPFGPYEERSDALAQLNSPAAIYVVFGGDLAQSRVAWHSDVGCSRPTDYYGALWMVVMPGWPDVICG